MNVRYLLEAKDVSQKDRKIIEEKLEKSLKFLGEYKESEVFMEIELNRDKNGVLYLEAMLRTPKHLFRSEVFGEDFLSMAIKASRELERQIKKTLGKAKDLKKRRVRSVKKEMTINPKARF